MVARMRPQVEPTYPDDLNVELLRLSNLLEGATLDFTDAAMEYARADNEYRKSKAVSYLAAITDDKALARKERRTIPALEATRDIECEDERLRSLLAEATKEAAKERVLSLRAQLNATQSVAASIRAELELARTGPAR
jgi:hypothetical protein